MGEIPIPNDPRPALAMTYCHIEARICSVGRWSAHHPPADAAGSANVFVGSSADPEGATELAEREV